MSTETKTATSRFEKVKPDQKVQKAVAADAAAGFTRVEIADKNGLNEKSVLSYLRHEGRERCLKGEKVSQVRKELNLSESEFSFVTHRGKWSADEVKILEENKDKPLAQLADLLQRTQNSVAHKLGLKTNDEHQEGRRHFRRVYRKRSQNDENSENRTVNKPKTKGLIDLNRLSKQDLIKLVQQAIT
jgi:DNA-binding transcriptional regulator YiaG